MKKSSLYFVIPALMLGTSGYVSAAEIEFHGDLNHRFQYTNQADLIRADSKTNRPVIHNGDVNDNFW